MEPIFFEPTFQERIWGGTTLKDTFGYNIPSINTGECWAISAHDNGPSIVKNGVYAGKTLIDLWKEHRELFGNIQGEKFPLLIKILDASKDLSVQVHPDDTYAQKYAQGELGKTECWYVIDCKKDSEIIYGHTAQTKEEFNRMIEKKEWMKLFQRLKVKPGDFFYVPSGTIHALGAGTLILETQQSSDTTYRVYDYDRTDNEGKKRELHLEKAIEIATIPHVDAAIKPSVEKKENITITTFIEEEFFSVYKWDIKRKTQFNMEKPFMLCSVIRGEGKLVQDGREYLLRKGSHFLLPNQVHEFEIEGLCELIVSHT